MSEQVEKNPDKKSAEAEETKLAKLHHKKIAWKKRRRQWWQTAKKSRQIFVKKSDKKSTPKIVSNPTQKPLGNLLKNLSKILLKISGQNFV